MHLASSSFIFITALDFLSELTSTSFLTSHATPSLWLPLTLSLYLLDDLELLMVGTPHLDFKELEKSTTYAGDHMKCSSETSNFA